MTNWTEELNDKQKEDVWNFVVFTVKEKAMAQAKKWNTGIVVPWLREFDEEERQASIQRDQANNVYS